MALVAVSFYWELREATSSQDLDHNDAFDPLGLDIHDLRCLLERRFEQLNPVENMGPRPGYYPNMLAPVSLLWPMDD